MEKTFKFGKKIINISNLEKILYPDKGYRKKNIVNYYQKIAPTILPHIKKRPLNMHRAPDGLNGETFYQQEAPDYFPEWIERINIAKKEGGSINHVLCNNRETLLYLAGQAALTLHIWLSREDCIQKPDKLLFDLDPPPGKSFHMVKKGAVYINEYFKSLAVKTFVMTTGSKGLHIVVPLKPEYGFGVVRDAAKKISKRLVNQFPEIFTIEKSKEKRGNRIFLDYLRNSYGQTSICPYCLRILPIAPVATPIHWEELKKPSLNAQSYHLGNIFNRLGQKKDPWQHIHRHSVDLAKIPID